MAKWIEVERYDGMGRQAVNVDLVQSIRTREGITRLVFGALPGGMDEILVTGAPAEALARVRAGESWPLAVVGDKTLRPPRAARQRRATPS